MNKLRCDSTWAALAPPQKEALTRWLFEENLGYDAVLARVQKEFGLTASKTSLAGYYQTLAREHLCDEFSDAHATAASVLDAEAKLPALRDAALKLIGKKLLDCTLQRGTPRELPALANLLLCSEQHEIQHAWLALAREKFEFKAAKAALKALPLVNEMNQEDEARETARIEKIKLALFGRRLLDQIESGCVLDPAKPFVSVDRASDVSTDTQTHTQQTHPITPEQKCP